MAQAKRTRTAIARPTVRDREQSKRYMSRVADLETLLDDANETVKQLSAAVDTVTAERNALTTQNSQLGQEILQQKDRYSQALATLDKERTRANEAEKRREAAENDNNFLRDQLLGLERDKARLEGRLERVEEFDPVTDQQLYRDGITSVEQFTRRPRGMAVNGYHDERPSPWHHRRG